MNRAKGRKKPITLDVIVGMLDSAARLDEIGTDMRRSEAQKYGIKTGEYKEFKGELREVIQLTGGRSLGVTLSAQILAGQAAELVLKYAYESDNPARIAPDIHDLHELFKQLPMSRKERIEEDYAARVKTHESPPGEAWKTAALVFHSGRNYSVRFRYLTEEGQTLDWVEPPFLKEAVCSVLASLGTNIRWGVQGA